MRLWTSASLFCCLFSLLQSYKILFYCPKNGRSQVIYLGALADILIDAGHDVTFLYSEINPDVSVIGTKRAKSIVIPAAESVKSHFGGDEYIADTWTMKVGNPFAQRKLVIDYAEVIAEQCAHLVENHNSVFEDLKKEKFDILLHEPMDYCQFGIMQAVEIKTHVMIMSAALMDGIAEAIGASTMPSTVPAWFGNSGEKMTLMERISNAIIMHISKEFTTTLHHKEEDVFRRFLGDKFAPFQDVIDNATYVISNTDPFIDFPRPVIPKVLNLGGMAVRDPKPLSREMEAIVTERKATVFISFGSIGKSYLMPETMKKSFAEMFKRFPDVTFIWKFETDQIEFLKGIQNVHTVKWAPQNDLLAHHNLKLFITHGGMGSVLETVHRGVPVLMVPLFGDQMRNAKMLERIGVGFEFDRHDLNYVEKLSGAVKELLTNESYTQASKRIQFLIENRPFDIRDSFLKQVEFAARVGPIPSMTSIVPRTGFVAYYMLDAVALVSAVIAFACVSLWLIVRKIWSMVRGQKKVKTT